jgi:hypothetical protein
MSKWTIGDFVVVKPGTRDPDLGGDIGGWQGRVVEFDQSDEHPDLICIEWDSVTLRQMPTAMIQQCEEQGMVWTLMWLDAHEVEETTSRDTSKDVARAQRELVAQSDWFYLGEQGRRIRQVMEGVNEYDDWATFRAWERYLAWILYLSQAWSQPSLRSSFNERTRRRDHVIIPSQYRKSHPLGRLEAI